MPNGEGKKLPSYIAEQPGKGPWSSGGTAGSVTRGRGGCYYYYYYCADIMDMISGRPFVLFTLEKYCGKLKQMIDSYKRSPFRLL